MSRLDDIHDPGPQGPHGYAHCPVGRSGARGEVALVFLNVFCIQLGEHSVGGGEGGEDRSVDHEKNRPKTESWGIK